MGETDKRGGRKQGGEEVGRDGEEGEEEDISQRVPESWLCSKSCWKGKGAGLRPGKHSLTTGGHFGTVYRDLPQGAVLSAAQTSKCLLDISILILHHSHPSLLESRIAVSPGETEEGKRSQ